MKALVLVQKASSPLDEKIWEHAHHDQDKTKHGQHTLAQLKT